MTDKAYRAVFLRVHPTGKMVLSLTTEADGREPAYAQLVAEELGVPPLDVKVVPADTDRFGVGHGFNTSPSEGTGRRDLGRDRQDPRQGTPARGHGARGPAGDASVEQRRVGERRRVRPRPGQTIEDIALYAHGTGPLPPGIEGGLDAQTVYRD